MSQDHPRPETPLASVIVPTHNRRNLLHRAVATLLAQSLHNVYTVPALGHLLRDHAGPRLTARTESRFEHRLRLLEMHAGFVAHYPHAASYHCRRARGSAAAVGDRDLSRRCFLRSFRVHRSPRTALSAARALSHPAR